MMGERERQAIRHLWDRKLAQEAAEVPLPLRHRNLEPASAEFLSVLAFGLGANRMLEIGGSSGISTIALAAAARATGGTLVSIEIEPDRQAESKRTIGDLGLSDHVDFLLGDAATVIPTLEEVSFVLIDCEKEDYVRFFDMLALGPGAVVVADNVLSHDLSAYVRHVRSRPGVECMTIPVGKGLEVTRYL